MSEGSAEFNYTKESWHEITVPQGNHFLQTTDAACIPNCHFFFHFTLQIIEEIQFFEVDLSFSHNAFMLT